MGAATAGYLFRETSPSPFVEAGDGFLSEDTTHGKHVLATGPAAVAGVGWLLARGSRWARVRLGLDLAVPLLPSDEDFGVAGPASFPLASASFRLLF